MRYSMHYHLVFSGQENLLQLAVTAARSRASLGEVSAALEAVWGRHVASTQVNTEQQEGGEEE